MSSYEIYNLILCLIVFVMLTGLFSFLIVTLIKLTLRTINGGLEDENIKKEYLKQQKKKESLIANAIDKVFPIFVCLLLGIVLCFSLYSRFTENEKLGAIPTVKVVESGSMQEKHEENKYLVTNNINDQIQRFDLIVLRQLPKEEDLKLYDIVVYKYKDAYIIHRIVGIEEPNSRHPTERWYLLKGDANRYTDEFPVTYDQMVSIYRGERIPFVGTFVAFMQSPAGMLCFLLVVFAIVATPIAEKKIANAKKARLAIIFASEQQEETVSTLDFGDRERKTFKEKLPLLSPERQGWYEQLVYVLKQLPNIRVIEAKYHEAYRIGNKPIAKIAIKGKSLYVYLAVDAKDYQGVQYGFKDVSTVKAHGQFSSECKVTSERKLKNVKKLLAGYGENIVLDMPKQTAKVEQVEIKHSFSFDGFGERKTFKQKLALLDAEKLNWYEQLVYVLNQLPNVRVVDAKYHQAYRIGNKPIAKIAIKGKSLYVYLAVDAKDYQGVQFGFKDVSNVKAHGQFSSECKVTSERKLKNVKKLLAGYGENVRLDMPAKSFEEFKKKKPLTLKQKLARLPEERKARFKEIVKFLSEKVELTKRESKTGITFKKGRNPIAKLTIKGKSVYVNLAVNPQDYTLAKYGIKDVSDIKAHANYPAQCKVTSDRRLKYIKEIINQKI